MMRSFVKALGLCLVISVLLCSLLSSCGKSEAPSESDGTAIAKAAERLLLAFEEAASYSLDGSYSLHSSTAPSISEGISQSSIGSIVGSGEIAGGSLSFLLTLSGTRSIDGDAEEYSEQYSLQNGEVEYRLQDADGSLVIGSSPLAELLPLRETAETLEAALTLFPLFQGECDAVLSAVGAEYTSTDLHALFVELASLYRSFLLRTGQGQILFALQSTGDAAGVLARYGSVTVSEDGSKSFCFSIPMNALFSVLLDRLALFSELSIGEAIDRLAGEGTAEKILSEIASTESTETLGELLDRIEGSLNAEPGSLIRFLDAVLLLADADEVSDMLETLRDRDAIEAFRMLSGDPAMSASDAVVLFREMLCLTPDGLLVALGREGDLGARLESLSRELRESSLTVSFPCKESSSLVLTVSYAFSGETEVGYATRSFSLRVTIAPKA